MKTFDGIILLEMQLLAKSALGCCVAISGMLKLEGISRMLRDDAVQVVPK